MTRGTLAIIILCLVMAAHVPARAEILSIASLPPTTATSVVVNPQAVTLSVTLTAVSSDTLNYASHVLNPQHPVSAQILRGLNAFARQSTHFQKLVAPGTVDLGKLQHCLVHMSRTLQFTAANLRQLIPGPPLAGLLTRWNAMVNTWNQLLKVVPPPAARAAKDAARGVAFDSLYGGE